jgi:hypothetical protein
VTSSLPARLLGAALALAAVLPAGPAAAADRWGSIFFSPDTHAVGYSFRHRSRGDAENAAYDNCDADDCIKATTFRNACGAVAVGENGGWGAYWGANGRAAQRAAVNVCRGNDDGCRVLRWQCAN